MVLATFRRLLEREIDEETLEKDATGVCTISKLLPHYLTKSLRGIDNDAEQMLQ